MSRRVRKHFERGKPFPKKANASEKRTYERYTSAEQSLAGEAEWNPVRSERVLQNILRTRPPAKKDVGYGLRRLGPALAVVFSLAAMFFLIPTSEEPESGHDYQQRGAVTAHERVSIRVVRFRGDVDIKEVTGRPNEDLRVGDSIQILVTNHEAYDRLVIDAPALGLEDHPEALAYDTSDQPVLETMRLITPGEVVLRVHFRANEKKVPAVTRTLRFHVRDAR